MIKFKKDQEVWVIVNNKVQIGTIVSFTMKCDLTSVNNEAVWELPAPPINITYEVMVAAGKAAKNEKEIFATKLELIESL